MVMVVKKRRTREAGGGGRMSVLGRQKAALFGGLVWLGGCDVVSWFFEGEKKGCACDGRRGTAWRDPKTKRMKAHRPATGGETGG